MAFAPGLLAGRRALVTGGGTGLGCGIARRFLELGASLAICGRRGAVLDAAAEAFRAEVPRAVVTTRWCSLCGIAAPVLRRRCWSDWASRTNQARAAPVAAWACSWW